MSERMHIEELRSMFAVLKRNIEFVNRYGELGSPPASFERLSRDDQKRLLYLALTEGDENVRKIARLLMRELDPPLRTPGEILEHLSSQDREELVKAKTEPLKQAYLPRFFISLEASKADHSEKSSALSATSPVPSQLEFDFAEALADAPLPHEVGADTPDLEWLKAVYSEWETEELVRIVTAKRKDYKAVYISLMEEELAKRGIPIVR